VVRESADRRRIGVPDAARLDLAWPEVVCPLVRSGSTMSRGSHFGSSDAPLLAGDTFTVDFGLRLTLEDGSTVCSDLRPLVYVARAGEAAPPPPVERTFSILRDAIEAAVVALEPGVPGFQVDADARAVLERWGCPDYEHATGHAIGALAHDPGPMFDRPYNP